MLGGKTIAFSNPKNVLKNVRFLAIYLADTNNEAKLSFIASI
jgi:hypothetical protein